MKKIIAILLLSLIIVGCGYFEKTYDNANYESITNERGRILLVGPDGQQFKVFENAKVLYADSDSLSLWIITGNGSKIYWQGFCMIELQ